jgi:hypothetical protein
MNYRALSLLAETKGFEPLMRLNTPYSLSRGAPSATRSRFLLIAISSISSSIISRLAVQFIKLALKKSRTNHKKTKA